MNVAKPLEDLVVQETGEDVALAFCGKYLASLGARVHIDDGPRFPEEREALSRYLDVDKTVGPPSSDADVVLTSWIDEEVRRPRTIRVVVTDNGPIGPHAQWVGGELLAQASSGLMWLVGAPERPPLQIGGHQMDYATGYTAFTGLMIALTARDRHPTQEGQDVHVSRLETGAYIEWKGKAFVQGGHHLGRGEEVGPVVVRASDGYFGLYYRQSDWDNLVEVFDSSLLRADRFSTAEGRAVHRRELEQILSDLASARSSAALYKNLQAAGVPAGPVYAPDTLQESPQLTHRRLFQPVGSGYAPGMPLLMNNHRPGEAA
ncbi:CoA transferase [Nesterenkonia suensis]